MGRGAIGNLSYIDGKTPLVGLPLEQIRATTLQLSQQYHENIAKNDEFAIKAAQINTISNDTEHMKKEINKAQNQVYDKVKGAGGWQHASTAVSNATVGLLTGDVYKATQQRLGEYTAYQEKLKESDASEEYKAIALAWSLQDDANKGGLYRGDDKKITNRFLPTINLGKGHDLTEPLKQMLEFAKAAKEDTNGSFQQYMEVNKYGELIKDYITANSDHISEDDKAKYIGIIKSKVSGISQQKLVKLMSAVIMNNSNVIQAATNEMRLDIYKSGATRKDVESNFIDGVMGDAVDNNGGTRYLVLSKSASYKKLSKEEREELAKKVDKEDKDAISRLANYLKEGIDPIQKQLTGLDDESLFNAVASNRGREKVQGIIYQTAGGLAYSSREIDTQWLNAITTGASAKTAKDKAGVTPIQSIVGSTTDGSFTADVESLQKMRQGLVDARAKLIEMANRGETDTQRYVDLKASIENTEQDLYNENNEVTSLIGNIPKSSEDYKDAMTKSKATIQYMYGSRLLAKAGLDSSNKKLALDPRFHKVQEELITLSNEFKNITTFEELKLKIKETNDKYGIDETTESIQVAPSLIDWIFGTKSTNESKHALIQSWGLGNLAGSNIVPFDGSYQKQFFTQAAKKLNIKPNANKLQVINVIDGEDSTYVKRSNNVPETVLTNPNNFNISAYYKNDELQTKFKGKSFAAITAADVDNDVIVSDKNGSKSKIFGSMSFKHQLGYETNTNNGVVSFKNVMQGVDPSNPKRDLRFELEATDPDVKANNVQLQTESIRNAYDAFIASKGTNGTAKSTYDLGRYAQGANIEVIGSSTPDKSNVAQNTLSATVFTNFREEAESFNINIRGQVKDDSRDITLSFNKEADSLYKCTITVPKKDGKSYTRTTMIRNGNCNNLYAYLGESSDLSIKQYIITLNN